MVMLPAALACTHSVLACAPELLAVLLPSAYDAGAQAACAQGRRTLPPGIICKQHQLQAPARLSTSACFIMHGELNPMFVSPACTPPPPVS
jgi:hypothetical protein